MTRQFTDETNEILAKINAMDVKVLLDSHDSSNMEFDGYVILKNDNNEFVCPLLAGKVFCLNRMYLDEGNLVLSRMSVAGNINARYSSLEAAVQTYRDFESPYVPTIVDQKIWRNTNKFIPKEEIIMAENKQNPFTDKEFTEAFKALNETSLTWLQVNSSKHLLASDSAVPMMTFEQFEAMTKSLINPIIELFHQATEHTKPELRISEDELFDMNIGNIPNNPIGGVSGHYISVNSELGEFKCKEVHNVTASYHGYRSMAMTYGASPANESFIAFVNNARLRLAEATEFILEEEKGEMTRILTYEEFVRKTEDELMPSIADYRILTGAFSVTIDYVNTDLMEGGFEGKYIIGMVTGDFGTVGADIDGEKEAKCNIINGVILSYSSYTKLGNKALDDIISEIQSHFEDATEFFNEFADILSGLDITNEEIMENQATARLVNNADNAIAKLHVLRNEMDNPDHIVAMDKLKNTIREIQTFVRENPFKMENGCYVAFSNNKYTNKRINLKYQILKNDMDQATNELNEMGIENVKEIFGIMLGR